MNGQESPDSVTGAQKKKAPRIWHDAHEEILKEWGEAAACYRYMHFNAYKVYKSRNIHFTLPIIVISTVTGTANFAQSTFPSAWQRYVPSVVGAFNLIAALATTVMQFLKINELMESHRVSYISYAKLSRNIRLELTLPEAHRSQHGATMVDISGNEYGRLIEQCPPIPDFIMKNFREKFNIPETPNDDKISYPEIMGIRSITTEKGTKDRRIVEEAIEELKRRTKKTGTFQQAKDAILRDLRNLRRPVQPADVEVNVEIPTYGLSVSRLKQLFEGDEVENEIQEHAKNGNVKN